MAISLDVSDIKPLLSTFGLGDSPSTKLPDVSNLPVPPMPVAPPPTPAQAGFKAYAADPQNQAKIANSLQAPGQSILPPNVAAPNSWNPPAASSTPIPSSVAAPSTPAPLSGADAAIDASNPAPQLSGLAPLNSLPKPAASPFTPPAQTLPTQAASLAKTINGIPESPAAPGQIQSYADWSAANPNSIQTPLGNKGKIFQAIAAGLIGAAGGVRKNNPNASEGTEYANNVINNNNAVVGRNQANYRNAVIQPLLDAQAQQQSAANLKHTQIENEILPEAQDLKEQAATLAVKKQQDSLDQLYSKQGFKPDLTPEGTRLGSYSVDPDSPITKKNADRDSLVQAQVASTQAQADLRKAQSDLDKSKNDPNSPAYKLAYEKLAVARQNASAASTRASAYMGRYMQGAYNVGLDGKTLAGAPIISDDTGNQTVVGSTNAGLATKNQSNAAQFNDVHGATDNVRQTARALTESGGKLNSPGVIYAMQHPEGSVAQFIASVNKQNLSPEERAYVISNRSAHENIQALRKSAGGTATDSAVAKLDSMIPDGSTPDLDYLNRQLDQIDATANRLGKGATTATGGLTVRGQGRGSIAPPAKNTPNAGSSGMGVSLAQAKTLAAYKNKTDAQITAAIKAQGHTVLP